MGGWPGVGAAPTLGPQAGRRGGEWATQPIGLAARPRLFLPPKPEYFCSLVSRSCGKPFSCVVNYNVVAILCMFSQCLRKSLIMLGRWSCLWALRRYALLCCATNARVAILCTILAVYR